LRGEATTTTTRHKSKKSKKRRLGASVNYREGETPLIASHKKIHGGITIIKQIINHKKLRNVETGRKWQTYNEMKSSV
jgi:hypothetical protein